MCIIELIEKALEENNKEELEKLLKEWDEN